MMGQTDTRKQEWLVLNTQPRPQPARYMLTRFLQIFEVGSYDISYKTEKQVVELISFWYRVPKTLTIRFFYTSLFPGKSGKFKKTIPVTIAN
jgi:hypothetical protein